MKSANTMPLAPAPERVMQTARLLRHGVVAFAVGTIGLASPPAAAVSTKTFEITVHAKMSASDSSSPAWILSSPDAKTTTPVLLPGDRVVFEVARVLPGPKDKRLGKWAQKYRYYSHKKCRRSWFKKKCTKYYATSPFEAYTLEEPTSPNTAINVIFRDEAGDQQERSRERVPPGGALTIPSMMAPRVLTVEGGVRKQIPSSFEGARGKKVGSPYMVDALGRRTAEPWFILKMSVMPPLLED